MVTCVVLIFSHEGGRCSQVINHKAILYRSRVRIMLTVEAKLLIDLESWKGDKDQESSTTPYIDVLFA